MFQVEMPDKILDYPEESNLVDGKSEPDNTKKSVGRRLGDYCGSIYQRLRGICKPDKSAADPNVVRYTLIDVFRHRTLTKYALVMCLLW